MKIQKIEKLNYARFRNYGWDTSLAPFGDSINILFGWNGSGKTTCSNFLRSIELGRIEKDCSFKLKTNNGDLGETSELNDLQDKLRVFNDKYVEDTLRQSSVIPHIFFAGTDAVDYSEDEDKLGAKTIEKRSVVLPSAHDDIAKSTADLIRSITGMNSFRKELTGGSNYSSYNKTDFEKRIKDIEDKIGSGNLSSYENLVRKDIDSLQQNLMNSGRIAKVDAEIAKAARWLLDNKEGIDRVFECEPIQQHSKRIEAMEAKQVAWVEKGIELHFNTTPLDNCLFCGSKIQNADELLKHFSDEVVSVIDKIDSYLIQIQNHTTNIAKFDTPTEEQAAKIKTLRSIFDSLTQQLKLKRGAITQRKVHTEFDVEKIRTFESAVEVDATSMAHAIEAHYVAKQFEAYRKARQDHFDALRLRDEIAQEILALSEKVRIAKQRAKSTHEPASALNRLFKIVFPYRKIEIADNTDGTGYVLRRDGEDCSFSSLSEGEKNFIALAYFIHSINDAQKMLADDGLVVIDDPVSSMDKQAIFQIFSMIVNEMMEHGNRQYFVLTHNLDFLGHLKERFAKKINNDDVKLYGFSATDNGCVIERMHPLLKDHRSDYYYVFSVLFKFKDNCDPEDAYLIVNLLRRWLETFLEFKFSTSGDLQSTLDLAFNTAAKLQEKNQPRDPFSADALVMYRFINHGSHGFSDPETTDDSLLSGADKRIREALKLVEILDPLHFNKLEKIAAK